VKTQFLFEDGKWNKKLKRHNEAIANETKNEKTGRNL
jgi:hypothetical protein